MRVLCTHTKVEEVHIIPETDYTYIHIHTYYIHMSCTVPHRQVAHQNPVKRHTQSDHSGINSNVVLFNKI